MPPFTPSPTAEVTAPATCSLPLISPLLVDLSVARGVDVKESLRVAVGVFWNDV